MSPSRASEVISWLSALADGADDLPRPEGRAPYFSQRHQAEAAPTKPALEEIARRVYRLVKNFDQQHFFSETVGFECIDGYGDSESSPATELSERVGKPDLWMGTVAEWSEDDLCDFIEVFHDLAARPTCETYHSFGGCGWHPASYARRSGQALYRWQMNELLDSTSLGLRLADDGEDVGRLVHSPAGELSTLIAETLAEPGERAAEVEHAVHLFRARQGSRVDKRSSIVARAGILEQRRALLKEELLKPGEGALFQIANKFDLRHRDASQLAAYDDDFLEWIFYWYLATVRLTEHLLQRPA